MKIAKRIYIIFGFIIALLMTQSLSWVAASPALSREFQMTGVVRSIPIETGFYGIVGDDGKKYQPTNLPRNFRKDGLVIRFTAQIQEDKVSSVMWGTIIEMKNSSIVKTTLPDEERSALYVLLKRIDAFNTKDLVKLQQIDNVAKDLSPQQFASWLANYSNYTLRYVEIVTADSTSIVGKCWYTRELENAMTLHGNVELAYMDFTLRQTSNGWKLTDSGYNNAPTEYNTLNEIQAKAQAKYGTDNLAKIFSDSR